MLVSRGAYIRGDLYSGAYIRDFTVFLSIFSMGIIFGEYIRGSLY